MCLFFSFAPSHTLSGYFIQSGSLLDGKVSNFDEILVCNLHKCKSIFGLYFLVYDIKEFKVFNFVPKNGLTRHLHNAITFFVTEYSYRWWNTYGILKRPGWAIFSPILKTLIAFIQHTIESTRWLKILFLTLTKHTRFLSKLETLYSNCYPLAMKCPFH